MGQTRCDVRGSDPGRRGSTMDSVHAGKMEEEGLRRAWQMAGGGPESSDARVREHARACTCTDVLLKWRFFFFLLFLLQTDLTKNHSVYCKKASHMRIASSLRVRLMTIIVTVMTKVSKVSVSGSESLL